MKKEKTIRKGYNIRITPDEMEMMRKLRTTYCVNVAQFLRKSLTDLYENLRNKK